MPKEQEDEILDRGDFYGEEDDNEDDDVVEDNLADDEDEELDEDEGEDTDSEEDDETSEDDEESDEGDEDESEDTDEDEDEEEDDDAGNQRVPRSRLNQVIQQREEAKERSAWLEDQLEALIKQRQAPEPVVPKEPEVVVPAYDFAESQERYIELILEGSVKEAAVLHQEMEAAKDAKYMADLERIRTEAAEGAKTHSQGAIEAEKFNKVLDTVMAERPYLDADSDDYNARAVSMTNHLMSSYMGEGLSKAEAMLQAVSDVAPLFDGTKEKEPEVLGSKKASVRTKTARKKAAETAKKQPPSTQSRGASKSKRDLDTINIGKLSDKDFNSLTSREKAALRGD